MYLQYFGLRENPFSIPPDPHYLYLSRGHQEAFAHLQYGLGESGGFVQLTGEVGTGKTLLVRALVERLPEFVDVALILYPVLTVAEFVAAICDELRIPRPAKFSTLKQLIDALNAHLLQSHAQGRHTVLIIDEAQNLSREVLEQIRLLTNLETTKQKLLQIILIGQPELSSLLAQRDLRQLAQRITARYRLIPLTYIETCHYIAHRCHVAGAQTSLFNQAAKRRVHALSRGIPRLINMICDRALLGAYTREKTIVEAGIVDRAASEVGSPSTQVRRLTWRVLVPASMALLIILVFLGWKWFPAWISSPPIPDESASAASTNVTAGSAANNAVPVPAGTAASTTAAKVAPANAASKSVATLDSLLASPEIRTDTESAMKSLFVRWGLDYAALVGATGCERALKAGVRCIYMTGTWNNLRQHNRPAVIELQDATGRKHHVLVASLTTNSVSLEMGGLQVAFTLDEVGRAWFGKYLLLWRPVAPEQGTLRLGDRGDGVIWLRDALARYRGDSIASDANDIFDSELEVRLKEFQMLHRLAVDGVAGQATIALLHGLLQDNSPTLATDTAMAEER